MTFITIFYTDRVQDFVPKLSVGPDSKSLKILLTFIGNHRNSENHPKEYFQGFIESSKTVSDDLRHHFGTILK